MRRRWQDLPQRMFNSRVGIESWPVLRQLAGTDRLGRGEAARSRQTDALRARTGQADRVVDSTVLELAKKAGVRTGDVSTAELGDATPAVQAAHVADRSCEGPADMANCPLQNKVNGGPGSISEQQVQTGADVYLGGGKARFAQTVQAGPYKGRTVIDQAEATGYDVVT